MKRQRCFFGLAALGLAAVVLLSGCGEGTANARIAFADKSRGLTTLRNLGPASIVEKFMRPVTAVDSFKMRFVAAYLVEDIASDLSNTGAVSMVYLHPDCLGDISTCGIPGSGKAVIISDYFDFTTAEIATEAVNSTLRAVATGTYRYVRLAFCEDTVAGDQIEFQLAGMSGTQVAKTSTCTVTSLKADPPISIGSGGQVTVTLSYDPKEFFQESATDLGNGLCSPDATPTPTLAYWCLSSINGSATDPTLGIVATASGS